MMVQNIKAQFEVTFDFEITALKDIFQKSKLEKGFFLSRDNFFNIINTI